MLLFFTVSSYVPCVPVVVIIISHNYSPLPNKGLSQFFPLTSAYCSSVPLDSAELSSLISLFCSVCLTALILSPHYGHRSPFVDLINKLCFSHLFSFLILYSFIIMPLLFIISCAKIAFYNMGGLPVRLLLLFERNLY